MKTISHLLFAAATLGAAGVASAQISNTGDLILFVTDTATNAAFVQDLGTLTGNVNPTGCTSTNGSCSSLNALPTPVTVGSIVNPTVAAGIITAGGIDTALASFLTAQGGGNSTNFVYGILGFTGGAGVAFNNSIGVSTLDASPAQMAADYIAGYSTSGPFATNVASLFFQEPSTALAVGNYNEIVSWLASVQGGSNSTNYGNGGVGAQAATTISVLNSHALGSASYLWAIAANGAGDANFYGSSTAITIGTDGSISGLVSTAVPLPAALWLLGSGLLGLAGISRRRLA